MSRPLSFVLQAAGCWHCKFDVALCLHHVAGVQIERADQLVGRVGTQTQARFCRSGGVGEASAPAWCSSTSCLTALVVIFWALCSAVGAYLGQSMHSKVY